MSVRSGLGAAPFDQPETEAALTELMASYSKGTGKTTALDEDRSRDKSVRVSCG